MIRTVAALLAISSPALANPGDAYLDSLRRDGQVYRDDRGVAVYRSGPDTVTLGPDGRRVQCHEFAGQTYCRGD